MATPAAAAAAGWPRRHVLAADHDLAGVGGNRAGQDAHHRRLACTVLADEADDLTPVQRQIVHVEHAHRAVDLLHADQAGDRGVLGHEELMPKLASFALYASRFADVTSPTPDDRV